MALLAAATPPPWDEFCESGDWWIGQRAPAGEFVEGAGVAYGTDAWSSQANVDLVVAAVNALPHLLDALAAAEARVAALEADAGALLAALDDAGDPIALVYAVGRLRHALRKEKTNG